MSAGVPRTDAAGERLRLLHVHAHPDDESSKGAATTAKYVAEGVEVVVATCTGGERGSILNPAMDRPEVLANIAEIRRKEMDLAREILGVEQVWLGLVDSGLPEGDPLPSLPEGSFATMDVAEAAVPLIKLIRTLRPHVMTTYDENGGYPHPDHIMCHKISVYAFDAAADPDAHPELGSPWAVPKLYYNFGFHYLRTKALDDAMIAAGLESPYAERLATWKRDPEHDARVTTRVECADYFPVRDQALHGPRDPGRPARSLVQRAAGHPPGGLAHRGLGTRPHPGRDQPARARPVRRHRGPGGAGDRGYSAGMRWPRK